MLLRGLPPPHESQCEVGFEIVIKTFGKLLKANE